MKVENGLLLDLNKPGIGHLLQVSKNNFGFNVEVTDEAIEVMGWDSLVEASLIALYHQLQKHDPTLVNSKVIEPIVKKVLEPSYTTYFLEFPAGYFPSILELQHNREKVLTSLPEGSNKYKLVVEENCDGVYFIIETPEKDFQQIYLKLQNLYPNESYLIEKDFFV